jgi:hypothetical protein
MHGHWMLLNYDLLLALEGRLLLAGDWSLRLLWVW